MDGSLQAAVTPDGVRDGDPAVLAALVARRGPAVLAFCEAVCAPQRAAPAAAEAFARFRALVTTVDDTTGLDPEVFLLGATRHAAASMARPPADDRGVLRVLGRGANPETTATVPALLAARADDMLGTDDLERLSRLLERSAGCREVEAAFRRAERNYRRPPERPIAPATVDLIVSAMQAAAPLAPGFARVPGPSEPEPVREPAPPAEPAEEPPRPPAVDRTTAHGPAAPAADDEIRAELIGEAQVVLPEPAQVPPPQPEPGPVPADAQPPDTVAPDDEPDDEPEEDPFDEEPAVGEGVAVRTQDASAQDTAVLPALTPRRRRGLPRPRLPHGGGLSLPRPARGTDPVSLAGPDHSTVFRLVLPAAAIVIAVLVMLAIAGVFGGDTSVPTGTLLLLAGR